MTRHKGEEKGEVSRDTSSTAMAGSVLSPDGTLCTLIRFLYASFYWAPPMQIIWPPSAIRSTAIFLPRIGLAPRVSPINYNTAGSCRSSHELVCHPRYEQSQFCSP